MNTVIGILNGKGGVSKTTSSIYLATALAEQGKSVELWDSDPQGGSYAWAYAAEENQTPLPFEVVTVNKREVKNKQAHTDFVIIDTPPAYTDILDNVARRSDFVIIPTAHSTADLEQVFAALEALPEGKDGAVLIAKTNVNTVMYRETLKVLAENEVPHFKTAIKNLESINQSTNTRPKDLAGYESVARELLEALGE